MKIKSKSSHLLALTSAALSMPAFSAAQPVETEISVRTSLYKEENVPQTILFSAMMSVTTLISINLVY